MTQLEALREAGRIASRARVFGQALIVAGAKVRDVCQAVDDEIARLGGALAFPTQSSRNAVAAHHCPGPDDHDLYGDGDLAKLDLGVHLEGHVVDTATTVNVGDAPSNRPLVEAAVAALGAAIGTAGPDVPIERLSQAIAREIEGRGLRSMKNLCGHGVGRYVVHCPPPIPNSVVEGASGVLRQGMVVAIEPFATDGPGEVREGDTAEVFRVPPQREWAPGLDAEVFEAIRAFQGLPFGRRQLGGLPRQRVDDTLRALWTRGWLAAYPPLIEAAGHMVAQAEHTIYVGEGGVEVLTA
ncbi:MAG: M24 family metallopeptidase [Vicinamibacteria bacterium]